MLLTNLTIERSKPKEKPYKLSDGDGLFLVIQPNGRKYWRLKYSFGPREKTLSIGRFPEVGLAEARLKRNAAKSLLRENVDPSLDKQLAKQRAVQKLDHSFGAIAREWYENNLHTWTPRHAKRLWRRLEKHIIPFLGNRPISEIPPRDLLMVLRQVQATGATETTHRLLWICDRIFKYAVVIDAAQHNPASNLSEGLKPHRHLGYPVIPLSELPNFLRAMRRVDARPQDKIATELLLLTSLRNGELRQTKWRDVNLGAAEIRVRKEVMKMREEHLVPLSRQAIDCLHELWKITGHQEWLFPNQSTRVNPFISENTINGVIRKMGYKGLMVAHSFRTLFSTILNEHEFHTEAIERQLSHAERNSVRAAYNRAQHLSTRRHMMQWWADYLDAVQLLREGDAAPHIGNSPANRASADLHLLRVNPGFDSAIPSGLAYRN